MIYDHRDQRFRGQLQGKIVVTGAAGFVGSHLMHTLPAGVALGIVNNNHPDDDRHYLALDLLQPHALDVLRELRPRMILHTAAISAIQNSEADKARAWHLNAEVPVRLAQLSVELRCRFIHLSTDMVFDGLDGDYTEEDTPNPINYYGRSKLAAEQGIAEVDPEAVIARLALVYGFPVREGRGASFLQWIFQQVAANRPVPLFSDEWRTPVEVKQLCAALVALADSPACGIFHLAGAEKLNRVRMGEVICRAFGFSEELLQPMTRQQANLHTSRPRDLSMRCSRLNAQLNRAMLSGFSERIAHLAGKAPAE